jgi:hypothetical protein
MSNRHWVHRSLPTVALALLFCVCHGVPSFAFEPYATTVQLPTFNTFSVMTTVSVPDRGGASLGGIGRAYSGRNENGIPIVGKLPFLGPITGGRGIGSSVSSSGVSVHATIIDHDELDKAVLAEAASRRGSAEPPRAQPRESAASDVAHKPFESVAAIKARRAAEDAVREEQVIAHFQKAEAAEAAGRLASARSYYLLAAKQSQGERQQMAQTHAARLARLIAEQKR